jgi:hypothetical protein
MPNAFVDDQTRAISTAQAISDASEAEVSEMVLRLCAAKRLYSTIHELNGMLSSTRYRSLALRALKRVGLEYAG